MLLRVVCPSSISMIGGGVDLKLGAGVTGAAVTEIEQLRVLLMPVEFCGQNSADC